MTDAAKEVVVELFNGGTDEPGKIVALFELHFVHEVVADPLPVLYDLLGPPRYELHLVGLSLRGAESLDLLHCRIRMKLVLLADEAIHADWLLAEVRLLHRDVLRPLTC